MKMAEESAKVFSKALTKEQKSVDLPHCSTIKLVDFFWDQLVMFISFILLALAGILCFSLFIWDTNEVQCYLLPESATLHSFQRYERINQAVPRSAIIVLQTCQDHLLI